MKTNAKNIIPEKIIQNNLDFSIFLAVQLLVSKLIVVIYNSLRVIRRQKKLGQKFLSEFNLY